MLLNLEDTQIDIRVYQHIMRWAPCNRMMAKWSCCPGEAHEDRPAWETQTRLALSMPHSDLQPNDRFVMQAKHMWADK